MLNMMTDTANTRMAVGRVERKDRSTVELLSTMILAPTLVVDIELVKVDLVGARVATKLGVGGGVLHGITGYGVDVEVGGQEGRFSCHIGCAGLGFGLLL